MAVFLQNIPTVVVMQLLRQFKAGFAFINIVSHLVLGPQRERANAGGAGFGQSAIIRVSSQVRSIEDFRNTNAEDGAGQVLRKRCLTCS